MPKKNGTDKPKPTKIKMPLRDLVQCATDAPGFVSYLTFLSQKPLKGKTAFRVKRVLSVVRPIITDFNETKNDLIKKHGKKDEKGESWSVPEGSKKWDAYQKEINEVLDADVEFEIMTLSIDDLESPDESKAKGYEPWITGALLDALDWLMEE